jgi:hypothetical protein
MDRSADETDEEETLYDGLLKVLKDTTGSTTARLTLEAIVAGAREPGFALPGLKPAPKPKKLHGSGPAIPTDLADGGTLVRWIRAASAELPCELTRAAAGWTACKMDMNMRIRLNKHVRPCSHAHVVGGR